MLGGPAGALLGWASIIVMLAGLTPSALTGLGNTLLRMLSQEDAVSALSTCGVVLGVYLVQRDWEAERMLRTLADRLVPHSCLQQHGDHSSELLRG